MIEEYSQSILNFIKANPESAFIVVVTIAFLESMAVIGVLIPGWLLLVGIGALVGGGLLPFYPIVLAMFIGAVIGEGLSYYLGYHYRDSIRHWRWLDNHQTALQRADNFIRRYGVMSLVIARFVGPLRAILPVVAGVAGMRQRLFWVVNILSGIFWAPIYLMPGVLVGTALALPEGSKELGAVAVVAITLFSWLAQRWWSLSETPEQHESKTMLKIRSALALVCAVMTLIVFALSEPGQLMLETLGKVLSRLQ